MTGPMESKPPQSHRRGHWRTSGSEDNRIKNGGLGQGFSEPTMKFRSAMKKSSMASLCAGDALLGALSLLDGVLISPCSIMEFPHVYWIGLTRLLWLSISP